MYMYIYIYIFIYINTYRSRICHLAAEYHQWLNTMQVTVVSG